MSTYKSIKDKFTSTDANTLITQNKTLAQLVDNNGLFTGVGLVGGNSNSQIIVVSTAFPDDADGRANGTIYIRVA